MNQPAAGHLLVSDPFLADPNFSRTVVFLTAHDETGTVGFVLNRSTQLTLEDVLQDFAGIKNTLFYGGPVEQNTLHYIHRLGNLIPDAREIQEGIYWGGDLEVLVELLREGKIADDQIRFFIGYSGWSAGQLDDEIEEKAWFVTPSRSDHVFAADADELWKHVLADMGPRFAILGNSPLDPRWN